LSSDSAGGTAKQGLAAPSHSCRWGKILQRRGQEHRILENENPEHGGYRREALACTADPENSRPGEAPGALNIKSFCYHKVIIMTDADIDSSHIRTLILTFFPLHAGDWWTGLSSALPPLYLVKKDGNYYGRERIAAQEELGRGGPKRDAALQGLGEMDAEQLWSTTMQPSTRSSMVAVRGRPPKPTIILHAHGRRGSSLRVHPEKNAKYAKLDVNFCWLSADNLILWAERPLFGGPFLPHCQPGLLQPCSEDGESRGQNKPHVSFSKSRAVETFGSVRTLYEAQ
jgi:DNA gyrase subunit B